MNVKGHIGTLKYRYRYCPYYKPTNIASIALDVIANISIGSGNDFATSLLWPNQTGHGRYSAEASVHPY